MCDDRINNVDGKKQLNVKGSGTSSGTEVITWGFEQGANTKFIIKKI